MPSTSVWIHLHSPCNCYANLKVRPGSCCEAYHQLPKRLVVSACFGHERHDSEPSRGCIEQTNLDSRLVSIYCTFLQSRPCWQLSGHGFGVLWQRVVSTRATEPCGPKPLIHCNTGIERLHLCGLQVLTRTSINWIFLKHLSSAQHRALRPTRTMPCANCPLIWTTFAVVCHWLVWFLAFASNPRVFHSDQLTPKVCIM